MKKKNHKYIFVVGGVMSSVGKGIAVASIGKILQARGLKVTAVKIDPYVNVDAGTMNPTEHGEVFVLDDGMECDQDMGNYERFFECDLSRANYMTTGSVYLSLIQKERNLEFKGRCVHVVPDVPLEVISRIEHVANREEADIVIIEVGGTVGDYQNVVFLEAFRLLKFKKPNDAILGLVSYVPALGTGGNELKTKPTQHAIRNLNSVGIHPDFVVARSPMSMDVKRKEKLEYMCGLHKGDIVSSPDVNNIYEIPFNFERDSLGDLLCKKLKLKSKIVDFSEWKRFVKKSKNATKEINIAVIGKYFDTGDFFLSDAYVSVIEAVKFSSIWSGAKTKLTWVNSKDYETNPKKISELKSFNGIVVPGGFGTSGVEGVIMAIKFARKNKIPYFGLCYGMQLAIIEYCRNVLGWKDAHTAEINPKSSHVVVDIMSKQKELLEENNYGATMRLGAYPAILKSGTIAYNAYGTKKILERHRHRYEVNPKFIQEIEKAGLIFSGMSPDGKLMEIVELPKSKHPFFLGTQFHPEFKARPLHPHPLFTAFIEACLKRNKKHEK
ncbi:MAG: CTP synthase [Candidatus Paceibacterota bacterium]